MQNLAIIAAAGLGKRMGNIDVPKVMLKDSGGRYFIDDALSFLRYSSDTDFCVLSRHDDYHMDGFFKTLNDYLSKKGFDKDRIFLQKTKPRSLVIAFLAEYFANSHFRESVRSYNNVILLPGDHDLTADDLDLDNLVAFHNARRSDVTAVYSAGWQDDSSKGDRLRLDDSRIRYISRSDKRSAVANNDELAATNVGVWVISTKLLNPIRLIPYVAQFYFSKSGISLGISAHAYFISPNWAGGRDTPLSIGK